MTADSAVRGLMVRARWWFFHLQAPPASSQRLSDVMDLFPCRSQSLLLNEAQDGLSGRRAGYLLHLHDSANRSQGVWKCNTPSLSSLEETCPGRTALLSRRMTQQNQNKRHQTTIPPTGMLCLPVTHCRNCVCELKHNNQTGTVN